MLVLFGFICLDFGTVNLSLVLLDFILNSDAILLCQVGNQHNVVLNWWKVTNKDMEHNFTISCRSMSSKMMLFTAK